jgi:hypothetical protein
MNTLQDSPSLRAELLNPCDDPDWDSAVASHPDCQVFHSAAWAKVLCKTYQHTPLYLRFFRGDELMALLPLIEVRSSLTGTRGVSLPFTDSCEPLIFKDANPDFIITELSKIARDRKWKYFELRGGQKIAGLATPSVEFRGHTLDLRKGSEALFSAFAGSVRSAIRQAERSNLKVEVSRTRAAMMAFYHLQVRTRRRHGLPPQPLSFFLNIYEEVIKPGLGFITLAVLESRAVAAAVFLNLAGKAVYKFAASDERHQGLRGNNLVLWEAIKFLARSGVSELHFGRTSLTSKSLLKFKLAWGVREENISYFRFDLATQAWITVHDRASGFHNRIFGKLPLALNRLIGTMLYPHLA